jgi:hypothetical protein
MTGMNTSETERSLEESKWCVACIVGQGGRVVRLDGCLVNYSDEGYSGSLLCGARVVGDCGRTRI